MLSHREHIVALAARARVEHAAFHARAEGADGHLARVHALLGLLDDRLRAWEDWVCECEWVNVGVVVSVSECEWQCK